LTARQVLQLHAADNVMVALVDLPAGARIQDSLRELVLVGAIPAKHKFARQAIPSGGTVVMYGVTVGKAREEIQAGELLTTRNVHHEAAAFHDKNAEYTWAPPDVRRWQGRIFAGF